MKLELDVQRATSRTGLPDDADFERWVATALADHGDAVLTIRIVDSEESRDLNRLYRGKDAPTNVLSFPAELPAEIDLPLLGDLVLCAPLVAEEAEAQGKPEVAHWAHLTVHGVLHLRGYDHEQADAAAVMEETEIQRLELLGIANPYD